MIERRSTAAKSYRIPYIFQQEKTPPLFLNAQRRRNMPMEKVPGSFEKAPMPDVINPASTLDA